MMTMRAPRKNTVQVSALHVARLSLPVSSLTPTAVTWSLMTSNCWAQSVTVGARNHIIYQLVLDQAECGQE